MTDKEMRMMAKRMEEGLADGYNTLTKYEDEIGLINTYEENNKLGYEDIQNIRKRKGKLKESTRRLLERAKKYSQKYEGRDKVYNIEDNVKKAMDNLEGRATETMKSGGWFMEEVQREMDNIMVMDDRPVNTYEIARDRVLGRLNRDEKAEIEKSNIDQKIREDSKMQWLKEKEEYDRENRRIYEEQIKESKRRAQELHKKIEEQNKTDEEDNARRKAELEEYSKQMKAEKKQTEEWIESMHNEIEEEVKEIKRLDEEDRKREEKEAQVRKWEQEERERQLTKEAKESVWKIQKAIKEQIAGGYALPIDSIEDELNVISQSEGAEFIPDTLKKAYQDIDLYSIQREAVIVKGEKNIEKLGVLLETALKDMPSDDSVVGVTFSASTKQYRKRWDEIWNKIPLWMRTEDMMDEASAVFAQREARAKQRDEILSQPSPSEQKDYEKALKTLTKDNVTIDELKKIEWDVSHKGYASTKWANLLEDVHDQKKRMQAEEVERLKDRKKKKQKGIEKAKKDETVEKISDVSMTDGEINEYEETFDKMLESMVERKKILSQIKDKKFVEKMNEYTNSSVEKKDKLEETEKNILEGAEKVQSFDLRLSRLYIYNEGFCVYVGRKKKKDEFVFLRVSKHKSLEKIQRINQIRQTETFNHKNAVLVKEDQIPKKIFWGLKPEVKYQCATGYALYKGMGGPGNFHFEIHRKDGGIRRVTYTFKDIMDGKVKVPPERDGNTEGMMDEINNDKMEATMEEGRNMLSVNIRNIQNNMPYMTKWGTARAVNKKYDKERHVLYEFEIYSDKRIVDIRPNELPKMAYKYPKADTILAVDGRLCYVVKVDQQECYFEIYNLKNYRKLKLEYKDMHKKEIREANEKDIERVEDKIKADKEFAGKIAEFKKEAIESMKQ